MYEHGCVSTSTERVKEEVVVESELRKRRLCRCFKYYSETPPLPRINQALRNQCVTLIWWLAEFSWWLADPHLVACRVFMVACRSSFGGLQSFPGGLQILPWWLTGNLTSLSYIVGGLQILIWWLAEFSWWLANLDFPKPHCWWLAISLLVAFQEPVCVKEKTRDVGMSNSQPLQPVHDVINECVMMITNQTSCDFGNKPMSDKGKLVLENNLRSFSPKQEW